MFGMLVFTIFALNLSDCFFTLVLFARGVLEANPFMAYLLDCHPVCFVIVKLLLVMSGLFVLYKFRDNLFARICLLLALLFYFCVFVVHILLYFGVL